MNPIMVTNHPDRSDYKCTQNLMRYMETVVEETGKVPKAFERIFEMMDNYIKAYNDLREKHGAESAMYTMLDALNNLHAGANDETKPQITCKAGCSHCCHINVDVHEDEVRLIREYCRENNITIDKAYLLEQHKARKEYYKCVFLKDNLCSIYEVRPSACRKYFVITNPDLCDNSTGIVNQVGVYFNIDVEILLSAIANTQITGKMPQMFLKQIFV